MIWALQLRAWFCFAVFNIVRCYSFASMTGMWYRKHIDCTDLEKAQIEEEALDCFYKFNSDLLPAADVFRWVLISLIIFSILFSVFCYKWRFLANLCLYLECTIRICSWFVPNSYNETHGSIDLAMTATINFLTFYCDKPDHLIFMTLYLAIELFFGQHFVY